MSLIRKLFTAAAPVALLALSACATPFTANVARFQVMPPPSGQSYFIQPADPALAGSLEFASYAQLVSAQLAHIGYQPAASPASATFVVMVDYGVDHGREKVTTYPGFGGFGGYGGWGGGYGGFGYGGFGRYGRFGGFGGFGGWGDPFFGGGWDYPDVESYTVFTSFLDVDISRSGDNQRLFEGHAQARSTTDDLTTLVPSLVTAMFTGFPGRPAENIQITVPPAPKGMRAAPPPPPPMAAPAPSTGV